MPDSLLNASVGGFLDSVASREAAPAGGSVAGLTVAIAAGLVAMAARLSGQLAGSEQMVLDAERIRRRAAALVDADAEAYARVLATYRLREGAPAERQDRIRDALEAASLVPLEIAELGARTVRLAVLLADQGNRSLRGDAVTAAHLADAAARSAAELVRINVGAGGCDASLLVRAENHSRRTAADLRSLLPVEAQDADAE